MVRARLRELGQDIPLAEQQTPEALGAFKGRSRKVVAHHLAGCRIKGEGWDEGVPA
jgi:hypothetical protein